MNGIAVVVKQGELGSVGTYAGPRELFPTIQVDQATAVVTVTHLSVDNGKRGQWGKTHEHAEVVSADGQSVRISGLCGLRNDRRNTGGRQKFCFFVFRGDSGHLYTHRAVASKGWLECPPDKLLARLRKLGIGADRGVVQQGDFLLKPSNGNGYAVDQFAHETMGAGHHRFACPVLYADGEHGRQYLLREPVLLQHEAVDGIKHPDVSVPGGEYTVGTSCEGVRHDNKRD
jgi:hypothetical protein